MIKLILTSLVEVIIKLFSSKYFLYPAAGAGLLTLSLLVMRPYVVEAWDCGVRAGLQAHQTYLQEIEKDYKNDTYFWAWINSEKYLPEKTIPVAAKCPENQGQKMEDWVNNKLWGYIYPQSYTEARQKLIDLHEENEKIFTRIKDFESRRPEWWADLREDLKKLCSLLEQVKRLSELKFHLVTSCPPAAPSGPPARCQKEIQDIEKLIEREELPLKENREKMKLKWPYLEEIINSRDINCEIE